MFGLRTWLTAAGLTRAAVDRRARNITEGEAAVAQIASEALAERLADWGVDTVFGLPGDGINGIMEGLRRHQDKVRFVLVHHEEAAAFMATAHAKATGKIRVCPGTAGARGNHPAHRRFDPKPDH